MALPSFDPALTSPKDRIRFELGDTGEGGIAFMIPDESIEALLGTETYAVALRKTGLSLLARIAQRPDYLDAQGGIRTEWRNRIEAIKTVLRSIEEDRVAVVSATVTAAADGGRIVTGMRF